MDRAEHAGLAAAGFAGVAIVEAVDEREEALAMAIALRETLEQPGHRAALATPDRVLAIRVAAELRRWNVAVEDSAGVPLSDSLAGRLARLAADAAALDFRSRSACSPSWLIRCSGSVSIAPRSSRAAAALEIGVSARTRPAARS